jgi:hypothetical protein
MRKLFGALPFLALAACGGAGPQSVGSIPVPATSAGSGSTGAGGGNSGGSSGGSTVGAPGTGGTGTGVTAGGSGGTTPVAGTSFLSTSVAKTFEASGGASSLQQDSEGSLYRGFASTTRGTLGTIDYDPRDGSFTVKLAAVDAGVQTNLRFQDPLHQTDFAGARRPQEGVPNLAGFSYLQAFQGSATDLSTFFYQRPGSSTVHVTLAGYVRNDLTVSPDETDEMDRAAFVFGDRTPLSQLPATGSATYTGGFLASMINNPSRDTGLAVATAYQWLAGNSNVTVNFGQQTFTLGLNGAVDSAGAANVTFPSGTAFFATGAGTVDLLRNGGFAGAFQSACFVAACGSAGSVAVQFNGITPGSNVTGASSIDGAFYGPGGVNVGGSFRIIGGVPDQRVDITGAFTGAKVGN